MNSFEDLGVPQNLIEKLSVQGISEPTLIQYKAIPKALEGRDILGLAQTGTGKTAAFVIPLLARVLKIGGKREAKSVQSLILAPTRELAKQIDSTVKTFVEGSHLRVRLVVGGVSISGQIKRLSKGSDILVATPGRLIDLLNRDAVHLSDTKFLVLDEADQMLDMGFIHDIKKIANLLPDRRQNLMFTATFSDSFRSLAMNMAEKAIEISVTNDNETGENINHYIHPVDKSRKAELLIELIKTKKWDQALVFTRTKHGADRLQKQLDKVNINSKAIHGNKTQNNRMKALEAFKNNKVQILVATDVAARGIDIKRMSQVINFDVPTVAKDYVHRIGRTGRGGDMGEAITLVSADEFRLLRDIEKLINKKLERVEIEGFEPEHAVPIKDKPNKKKFHNKKGFKKRNKSRKG